MSEVHTVTFPPSVGETVELPETVGRIDVGRFGGGQYGDGTLKIAVTGHGDMDEYVTLKVHGDNADLEDSSQVLGVDVATGELWYAVPASAYGGGA